MKFASHLTFMLFIIAYNYPLKALIPDDEAYFLKKATLTPKGMKNFAVRYNHQMYGKEFFPRCFLHITDFSKNIKKQQDPFGFCSALFSCFLQKLKETHTICPYAMGQMLHRLQKHVGTTFIDKSAFDLRAYLNGQITNLPYNQSELPEFIDATARHIEDNYYASIKSRTDAQHMFERFAEGTFDRLAWDADDENLWKLFTVLGSQCVSLTRLGVIHNTETLNHILWSLIGRYCYFLELWGSTIPADYYDQMISDLETNKLDFIELPENAIFMRSKKQYLLYSLKMGKAKAAAFSHGLLTEPVIKSRPRGRVHA